MLSSSRALDRHAPRLTLDSPVVYPTETGGMTMKHGTDGAPFGLSRRALLRAAIAGLVGGSTISRTRASRAQAPAAPSPAPTGSYVPRPGAAQYRFRIGATSLDPDGRQPVPGITVNGQYPGPEIRVREGATLRVETENTLTDQP